MQKNKRISEKCKELLFSKTLSKKNTSHKIAYIAVVTAFVVMANMFEFKFADTQFSLTIVISTLAGILIGPIFGFAACFLGDLVGFLYNSAGFMYMPWIGLSMGLTAFIAGLLMNYVNIENKFATYIKIAIVCVSTFLICTIAINTTAFWIIYNTKKVPFFAYLTTRLFVQGQIWNSVLNYSLLFVFYPVILKIKKAIVKVK